MTRPKTFLNPLAISATLHCLVGCAMGEIAGLIVGTTRNWSNIEIIILSTGLAFLFGYTLSSWSLFKSDLGVKIVLVTVLAADTLSVTTMEIVDNLVMLAIPSAINAGLVNPVFWFSMMVALVVAFIAALPVNDYLLRKGKGHALMHERH